MIDLLHSTTVWLALSFAIFLYILWKMGRDAIIGMLDQRIESIKNELETSENLRTEAQELLAQYQRKHRNAVEEAEKIVSNAQEHAAEIQKNADKELKNLIDRREKQLQDRIQMMKDSAEKEVRQYAANLTIEATREMILKTTDKKSGESMIDQSIVNISKELH